MQVLTNHLGYERTGGKRAVIQSTAGREIREARLIESLRGEVAYAGRVTADGTVSGWASRYFHSFDFSEFRHPGRYYLQLDDGSTRSEVFAIEDNLLIGRTLSDLLYYIKAQRCSGKYDRQDRSVPFYGSSRPPADLHGGWYDASGDTSKYLSHLSYANYLNPQQTPLVVWGLLEALNNLRRLSPEWHADFQERLTEEALHGADFLTRMQDKDGYFYATVFDQWTKYVANRRVCAYSTQRGLLSDRYRAGYRQGAGVAIAALARASQLPEDGEYRRSDYLAAARRGFAHLEEHNLEYLDDGRENIIDDYCALLAAVELFAAGREALHRQAAAARAGRLAARLIEEECRRHWWRTDDRGEMPFSHAAEAGFPVLALMRYLEVVGSNGRDPRILDTVRKALEGELAVTGAVTNPFGYARQHVRDLGGSRRESFFIPHTNGTGYWWQGENGRIASLAAAARKAAPWFADDRALGGQLERYATDQLDWILGRNPFDACMMNGHGRNNVEYQRNWRNAPGGIVNGITAGFHDERDIDFLPAGAADDPMHRWRWSEQWIVHPAWYLIAVTERVF
jgi:hypothetical protein